MARLWLILTAAVLVAAQPQAKDAPPKNDAKPDAVKEELKKLQGPWRMVSGERNGEKIPEDEAKSVIRSFTDDTFEAKRDGTTITKGKVKLDPSQKPKAIDVIMKGQDDEDVTLKGIYEVDGDSMKTCLAPPGQDRPKEFSSKEDSGHMHYVWKREKK